MSLADPYVQLTDRGDGSADVTLSFADDDHSFSLSSDGEMAIVQYEETLSWRGEVRVSEPDDDVYKEVMVSDEVTAWLDERGLDGIRRDRKH